MPWFSSVPECPISDGEREWYNQAFLWLVQEFGAKKVKALPVRIPDKQDFPFPFDHSEESAHCVRTTVAGYMDIDPEHILLHFYSQDTQEFGYGYSTERDKTDKYSAGLYRGKDENGKYVVAIEMTQLKKPVSLIATMAHELSHIKLLGEGRLEENNEHLTDMVPLIFGLGIFNANAAFEFSGTTYGWQMNRIGYLSQQVHGYLMALYVLYRQEKNPAWVKHLCKDVQAYFKRSLKYLDAFPEHLPF